MTIGIHQIILSHSMGLPLAPPTEKLFFGGVKSVQK